MTESVYRRASACAALQLVMVVAGTGAQVPARTLRDVVFEASVTELQEGLRSARFTSAQLVDAYLARIAAYDQRGPALNAMIRMNPNARREAMALDRERRDGRVRGPLHGIPIVLKDNYATKDLPTSAGSLALATLQTPTDAFVVRRLRDAGAVIIGKTNMHELAAGITSVSSLGGQTRNPYDPMRCPGGSSGGTGVAVAASFAAVGWGSDTCGSIRIPSAYNNLFGLRPTQGMASRTGIVPLSHTQDIAGPLARTVTDLAIALDATVGADPADEATRAIEGHTLPRFADSLSATALRGARLGVFTNYMTGDIDPEIRDTVRAAVNAMKGLGAQVIDVRVADFDSLITGSSVLNMETRQDLIDFLATVPNAPVSSLNAILSQGLHHDFLDTRLRFADSAGVRDTTRYNAAMAKQQVLRRRFIALLDSLNLDALVYPTMQRKPALVGEPQPGGTCQLSAHTGLPALSAPAGFTSDGLPVGVELLGRPFSDVRLVSMAYAFEQGGSRRRAPSTTPALNAGRAPGPVTFTASVPTHPGTALASFVFDALRNDLSYRLQITGVPATRVQAVVIRRADKGRTRVVHRLSGPGVMTTSGHATLSAADRGALMNGQLLLSVFAAERGTAPNEVQLAMKEKR